MFSGWKRKKEQLKALIKKLLHKNRTIVSSDNYLCMEIIGRHYPIKQLKFMTGEEYDTWIIPPEWNILDASLSYNGEPVATLNDSKLFVAAYSLDFKGSVTKEELTKHCFIVEKNPSEFNYEHRVAMNFQRRLNEWRLSVPKDLIDALPNNGLFEVEIKTEVKPGYLVIGEYTHHGSSGLDFNFLSHYCHTSQANDGLCGVVTMLEVVHRLKQRHPNPKYTYRALVMPETIGSSVYVSDNMDIIDNSIGAVFSEMGGAKEALQFVSSRRTTTYIDRIFKYVLKKRNQGPLREVPFRQGWGNDEIVFDAPGVGVPSVSLDRYPFRAYHTENDNMELVYEESLEEIVDILLDVVFELERDFIPKCKQRVPIYLTRYELYSDWTYNRSEYDLNVKIMDGIWSGMSVTDIALSAGVDVDYTHSYVARLLDLDLVEQSIVTPEYSKATLFSYD